MTLFEPSPPPRGLPKVTGAGFGEKMDFKLESSTTTTAGAVVYQMKSPWVSPDEVATGIAGGQCGLRLGNARTSLAGTLAFHGY